jgi:phage N-6-adenine-methyltransferase
MKRTLVIQPDKDATEIGDLYRKARMSLVDSVRFCIECGKRLKVKRDSLPRGAWLPWLRDNAEVLGFESRQTAHLLMKAAANVKLTLHLTEADAAAISRQIWGNTDDEPDDDDPADADDRDDIDLDSLLRDDQGQLTPKAQTFIREALEADDVPDLLKPHVYRTINRGETEWYTPAEYIAAARDVLGIIDLDPASCEIAQRNVQAKQYFTMDDDGLTKEWRGRVWLNPPYAQPDIADFVAKLVEEYQAGHVTEAILLTHNYSDTEWFHDAAAAAPVFCLTKGRIRFEDAGGEPAKPMQGQCFFYFGARPDAFKARFAAIGLVARPWDALAALDPATAEAPPPADPEAQPS